MKKIIKISLFLLLFVFGSFLIFAQKVNKSKKNLSNVEQVKEEPTVYNNSTINDDKLAQSTKENIKLTSEEVSKLKTFYYENGTQAQLSTQMKNYLNSVVLYLKENPKSKVIIDAHSNYIDPNFDNDKNSNERANNCLKYLMSKQIIKTRILAKGNGDRKPIAVNSTDESRKNNNRIEITVSNNIDPNLENVPNKAFISIPEIIEQIKEEPVFAYEKKSDDAIVKIENKVNKLNLEEAKKLKKIFYYENANQAQLSTQMKDYLNSVVDYLTENPKSTVIIDAHSDNTGTNTENQIKSDERAKLALVFLLNKNVSKIRIFSKGNGDRKPIADNKTEEGIKKNNRIEIKVTP